MPKAALPFTLDFALQGGGAHGAFTWGVLDRFLEEPDLRIEGVSGTSAGAMNAVVMVDGYAAGGAEGARAALTDFWQRVSAAARFSPIQRSPLDVLMGNWTLDNSPMYAAFDMAARVISPYDLNPLGINPLGDILQACVDFERVAASPIRLFVTATHVNTGRGRIFRNAELSPDVLLASACLPTMFQAVEIDGEPYWDGGYSGNPTMTPLVRECSCGDIVLVQINPVAREGTPRMARAIQDRVNEVAFNAPLLKELRLLALLNQVVDPGQGECSRWARMRVHRVSSEALHTLGASSKLNAEWAFLCLLRDEGRRAAAAFLETHRGDIGRCSSLDLAPYLEET
ncbi:patatin-like phospholipase family protein [Achromobacter sp. GG226]|uniref:patatin-like phospholipase family protein n=1 Tax=Verticiella alkaliphila TaxID=2779529 RepID=UPI001C0B5AE3|nr:patatin-like phospholipase family protein [Verticiella sp. GG226]MBU4611933.1 patatin-like phospholipase family protein [Verticiella sp. GG226]